jgi:hypothetical protein
MQQNLHVQGHLPVTFQITESFFADMSFSFGLMGIRPCLSMVKDPLSFSKLTVFC